MANREPIRVVAFARYWNFGLSLFSLCGAVTCVPLLFNGPTAGLLTKGFESSVCAGPETYGAGVSGMFVCFFIYSKLFELADTVILLLRKKTPEFLHYWHHTTVLLYCWHSYTTRIGTGLWFAAMNYSVHAVMYFYFGMSECGARGKAVVKPFALFVTLIQLMQMVFGIGITVAVSFIPPHPPPIQLPPPKLRVTSPAHNRTPLQTPTHTTHIPAGLHLPCRGDMHT